MDITEGERVYKALANRRRLAIVKLLHANGKMRVSDIAQAIKISFKATSKHLQVLKAVGFVESEQVSLEQWYSLTSPLHPTLKHTLSSL